MKFSFRGGFSGIKCFWRWEKTGRAQVRVTKSSERSFQPSDERRHMAV